MHLSDVKKFIRCKKLYQNSLVNETTAVPFLNIHIDICESIKDKLKIDQYLIGQPNQTNSDTAQLLKQASWVFRARFEYDDLRIKVPLVHVNNDRLDLYFISYSISENLEESINMLFSQYVLQKLGYRIGEFYLIYLNRNYVRTDICDNDLLWILTDSFSKKNKKIKDYVNDCPINPQEVLAEMKQVYSTNIVGIKSSKCTGRSRCQYYLNCFPQMEIKEDNSILTLVSSNQKEQMYQRGIKYLKEIDVSSFEGNRIQYAQVMADKNGGLYFDRLALKQWMQRIKFPLAFIDFEWDLYAIPPYYGMRPFDVLLFQYSLHIYDGKELKHYSYIGENDNRQQIAQQLVELIPDDATVLAYNAVGAEKIRFLELAQLFPQYEAKLKSIAERMVDMAVVFTSGIVYDVRMRGNFTLKTIENMIDEQHSYKDLQVNDGMKAVIIHRLMQNSSPEQSDIYRQQLFDYCGLDTYSLYKLYIWLNDILNR
ncbi:MAG: DUF2779 domain-containing protein [Erysipelotrichaceae bacterium]